MNISQVTTEEGKHLATQFGCPFYETSAALRHYIDDAFYTLIREIRKKEADRVCIFLLIKLRILVGACGLWIQFKSTTIFTLQITSNASSSEKLNTSRRSRWWRIRSIFALVFRRRRHTN